MKKIMKKWLVLCMIFAIALSQNMAAITVSAQEPVYTETAYTDGIYYGLVTAKSGLNVYTKPDLTTKKADGGVSYNWLVQCLAYTSNGFTKIQYYYGNKNNTFTGYVNTSYLKVTKSENKIPDIVVKNKFTNIYGYTGTVTAGWLYVHSSLDFDGNDKKIITAIPQNTQVQILAKSDKGYKIKFNNDGVATVGYVTKTYIKVNDALALLKVKLPGKTLNTSTKYKLQVVDNTKPYALTKTISYSSSKKSVASVSSKGIISVKKPGKAVITVKVKCGDRTKTLKVKVNAKEYFTFK